MINVLRQALKEEDLTLLVQDENLRYIYVHQPHSLWPEDAILGKTDAEMGLSAEMLARYIPLKERVLATGETLHSTDWRPSPTGGLLYVEATYMPIELETGKRGVLIKLRDRTTVKQAQDRADKLAAALQGQNEELTRIETRFRVALEDGQTTLMLQDAELNWIWMHNMPQVWQHWIDTGEGYPDGVPFGTYTQLVTNKMEAARTGAEIRTEDWFEHPDGEAAYYQCRFMPYQLQDGRQGVLTKIVNLTEMKRKEERLTELSRTLEVEKRQLNQVLNQLKAVHNHKLEELAAASVLQQSLVPRHITLPPGFAFAASMQTSDEVGGDYYDPITRPDGTLVLALGDATGHGLRAGIIMAMVKSYFQLLAPTATLGEILQRTSEGLAGMNLRQAYMGLQLFAIAPTGACEVATAGMPPVFVYCASTGKVKTHTFKGLFLGTHLPFEPIVQRFHLELGDMLLAASDGLTETRSPAGQLLGNAAVATALATHANQGPDAVINALKKIAGDWNPAPTPEDDTTLVALARV